MITTINEWKQINEEFNQRAYLKWKRENVSYRGMQEVGQENGGSAILGHGLYTAALSNKAMAKSYGTLRFAVNAIPKKPIKFKTLNDWEIWFYNTLVYNYSKAAGKSHPDKRDFYAHTTIEAEIQKMGYDGVMIIGREYVNYTPQNVMYFTSEAHLKEYYEYTFVNESLEHNKSLYRNTSQQWLINLLTNGFIKTENKEWISISQDPNSGGQDNYGNCHIVFNEEMIYNQGAIEIDYEDMNFWRQFPSICKHVTGFSTEEEYYNNSGYSGPEEANANHELTWEQNFDSYSGEEEVVISEIKYVPGLIQMIKIKNESLKPELKLLLLKYKIKH